MASEQFGSPEGQQSKMLEVWKPLTDGIRAVEAAARPTARELASPLLRAGVQRRATEANRRLEALKRDVDLSIYLTLINDKTGSVGGSLREVRTQIGPMVIRTVIDPFIDLLLAAPADVENRLKPYGTVCLRVIDFGDGVREGNRLVDNPWAHIREQEIRVAYSDTTGPKNEQLSMQEKQRKRSNLIGDLFHGIQDMYAGYTLPFNGGCNWGEFGGEALGVAYRAIKGHPRQRALLERMKIYMSLAKQYPSTNDFGDAMQSHIETMLKECGGGITGMINAASATYEVPDVMFLFTDEPPKKPTAHTLTHNGVNGELPKDVGVVSMQELIDLNIAPAGLFFITPEKLRNNPEPYINPWKTNAQALGAQWFDLDLLNDESRGVIHQDRLMLKSAVTDSVVGGMAATIRHSLDLLALPPGYSATPGSASVIRMP
ncbi:MAG: hypothetical protein WC489_04330 [Patescibacteria group bacterium]